MQIYCEISLKTLSENLVFQIFPCKGIAFINIAHKRCHHAMIDDVSLQIRYSKNKHANTIETFTLHTKQRCHSRLIVLN